MIYSFYSTEQNLKKKHFNIWILYYFIGFLYRINDSPKCSFAKIKKLYYFQRSLHSEDTTRKIFRN